MSEDETFRPPNLIALKPTKVWVLRPGEAAPEDAGVMSITDSKDGWTFDRLAFAPYKCEEESDGDKSAESTAGG